MAPEGQAAALAKAAGHAETAAARLEALLDGESGWRPEDLADAAHGYLQALDGLLACLESLPEAEAEILPAELAGRVRTVFARHDRIQARLLHAHQEIADLLPRLRQQRSTLDAYAGPPPGGGGFLDHQG